jgi:hypothetical protein
MFFLKKRTTKRLKKRITKRLKKRITKTYKDGVVGENLVSLQGWGGRGKLGFPTRMGW